MVDKVIAAARGAGLRPEGIDLAAFAMIRALHRPGPEEPVMYLSVGGLTNLAVAVGPRCLFTRVVGGGSEALAIELAERKGLTLEHSRAWLDHVGLPRPGAGDLRRRGDRQRGAPGAPGRRSPHRRRGPQLP